jgi:hypothetical protein
MADASSPAAHEQDPIEADVSFNPIYECVKVNNPGCRELRD